MYCIDAINIVIIDQYFFPTPTYVRLIYLVSGSWLIYVGTPRYLFPPHK